MNKKILIKVGKLRDKICVIKRTYNQRGITKITGCLGICLLKTLVIVINNNNLKLIELN
ncbi:50S ribosomal protein L24 [Candidatus Hodgkinia cicadicola]|nr:50S ribosomal protein L24 [Candidatus Hodgkinia cicadicola]